MGVINRILLVWTVFVAGALLVTLLTAVPEPPAVAAIVPAIEMPTPAPEPAPETKAKEPAPIAKVPAPKTKISKPLDIRSLR